MQFIGLKQNQRFFDPNTITMYAGAGGMAGYAVGKYFGLNTIITARVGIFVGGCIGTFYDHHGETRHIRIQDRIVGQLG
ncbi:hypothetical protein [Endozoicomonas sp.]|uniref:hypothetical protein n=1 Tax=Endozoicomonas sp. TaxID=1892382 RepID=UPI0028852788|nr:hypothetical protein [Endozoicomonas sp.]